MPGVLESDADRRVAVISALDFEKASLQALLETSGPPSGPAASRFSLFQAGSGAQKASAAAHAALEAGAVGLVSWGVAGGLHPAMVPGTVVLPEVVYASTGEKLETDRRWRDNLRRALSPEFRVHEGGLLSADAIIPTPGAKARAASGSGAVAVDMESAAIGRAALAAGRPFVVVRVILDGAGDRLPDVQGLVDQTGNRDPWAFYRIACRPTQWFRMLVLARRFLTARAALRRCASCAARDGFHHPEPPLEVEQRA